MLLNTAQTLHPHLTLPKVYHNQQNQLRVFVLLLDLERCQCHIKSFSLLQQYLCRVGDNSTFWKSVLQDFPLARAVGLRLVAREWSPDLCPALPSCRTLGKLLTLLERYSSI